jgi:hypothetical protein
MGRTPFHTSRPQVLNSSFHSVPWLLNQVKILLNLDSRFLGHFYHKENILYFYVFYFLKNKATFYKLVAVGRSVYKNIVGRITVFLKRYLKELVSKELKQVITFLC